MANSTPSRSQNFHVRSISFPSRSHPLVIKIEEDLHKLKTGVESSTTAECAYDNMQGLGDLYRCMDELLHLPSIQQALSHSSDKKWLETELEASVRLLDICGAVKDTMVTVEGHIQELQSSLRRRGDRASEEFIRAQICSKKGTRNNVKKCQHHLRRVELTCRSCPSTDSSCDTSVVARALTEAREITLSVLRRVLSFLSMSRPQSKVGRWSFVSRAMNFRKVSCDEDQEDASRNSYCYKDAEAGLECLFRSLIKNRATLLNILSLSL